MAHQCSAVPKNTIKRCKNRVKRETPYCGIHGRMRKEGFTKIRHYDGSIVQYENGLLDLSNIIGKKIWYWGNINNYLSSPKAKKEDVEKMASILRVGSNIDVTNSFIDEKIFSDRSSLVQFFFGNSFQDKVDDFYYKFFTGKVLEDARKFLGVCYNIKLNRRDLLVKVQARVRGIIHRKKTGIDRKYIEIRVRYREHINKIIKIQRWFRYWSWLKNLPVEPKRMVKHYLPNLEKIKFLQSHLRYYIHKKIRHSHGCPYSCEEYWMIPKETRVFYKYNEGLETHWRYYDVLWLHKDFLHQTEQKRFVIEPSTKKEFSDEFVIEVAKKVWSLTREKKLMMDDDGEIIKGEYYIENDWKNFFSRRSLYCFSLMLFDLFQNLNISVKDINPLQWRSQEMRGRYQHYFLTICPILYNMAQNRNNLDLCYTIQYRCGDILSQYMIFPDEDNMDVFSGMAIFNIHFFLKQVSKYSPIILDPFRSVIIENFKKSFSDLIS